MNLPDRDPGSFFVKGSFRPLRRVWVLVWIILCAVWAGKLILERFWP